mmetsp:Transcript_10273/g.35760  ORF Transcript_10273/g.35760 Transcript_10273/m.35760 type:complete len:214 (+) Transcript_10273:617-1258(+)
MHASFADLTLPSSILSSAASMLRWLTAASHLTLARRTRPALYSAVPCSRSAWPFASLSSPRAFVLSLSTFLESMISTSRWNTSSSTPSGSSGGTSGSVSSPRIVTHARSRTASFSAATSSPSITVPSFACHLTVCHGEPAPGTPCPGVSLNRTVITESSRTKSRLCGGRSSGPSSAPSGSAVVTTRPPPSSSCTGRNQCMVSAPVTLRPTPPP